MESEKVKEIKEALYSWQESVMLSTDENYVSHKVYNREILDYINELESENERLSKENTIRQNLLNGFREENGRLYDDIHKKGMQGLKKENNELKDRIAELEEYIKGNEQDAKAFVNGWHKDLETELKQFAERLKEELKGIVGANFIDETLKEFINE